LPASELYQAPWNFLGLPEELTSPERARAWVLPVPYEATTSYGAGTRNGPAAILGASRQVELYDREFGCEPAVEYGVRTLPPLALVHASPEEMVGRIEEAVGGILDGEAAPRLVAVLGGEHTISVGVARALARRLAGKLVAVQIDAHADLREEYECTPYSHACAARRIVESCPVFQVGIRNISSGEEEFRRSSSRVRTVFAEEALADPVRLLEALGSFVRGRAVYLTIDLDGLDPSVMPAVGTPEPGGLSWALVLEIARTIVRECESLACFDVVELAPIPGLVAPEFLAASLVYKLMSLALARRRA